MSFTDGKPRIATEEECKSSWMGAKNGKNFRCHMCGQKFRVGDRWRFVYANFAASPFNYGNLLVRELCDGTNEDVLRRATSNAERAKRECWGMLEQDA